MLQVVPVVHELSHRYNMAGESVQAGAEHTGSSLAQRLDDLREHIRKQIRKELKIKVGTENLKKVTTGEYY